LPEIHDSTSSGIVWLTIIASPFIGSFLGVAIHRLPAGRPIALDRSECDVCRHELGPLDLIPVFSWIGLRGHCRHCGARLSVFYPLIELASLMVAVWAATTASGWHNLLTCIIGWTLLVVAVIEWRRRKSMVVPALALVAWLAWLYVPGLIVKH
jgi:leader peptidase (prepilin peptidase)/N-methyltransferase